jgi:hypothetical protein
LLDAGLFMLHFITPNLDVSHPKVCICCVGVGVWVGGELATPHYCYSVVYIIEACYRKSKQTVIMG